MTGKDILIIVLLQLWFDVERQYLTTGVSISFTPLSLWFDVERQCLPYPIMKRRGKQK